MTDIPLMSNTTISTGYDSNQVIDYLSYLSRQATEKLTDILNQNGISVSLRWSSLLVLLFSLLIIYIGIKVTQPILKWIMIFLSVLLIIGLVIPYW